LEVLVKMGEELAREMFNYAIVRDYAHITRLYAAAKLVYRNYDLLRKLGIEPKLSKDDLAQILRGLKSAIRQKEKIIIRKAFLRGR